jgi:hypothetical protein
MLPFPSVIHSPDSPLICYHFLQLFIRQTVLWYVTISFSYSFAKQSSDMLPFPSVIHSPNIPLICYHFLQLFIHQTVLWYVTISFSYSFVKQSSDMLPFRSVIHSPDSPLICYHFVQLFIRQTVLWYVTISFSYSFTKQFSDMLPFSSVIHSSNSPLICLFTISFSYSFAKQSLICYNFHQLFIRQTIHSPNSPISFGHSFTQNSPRICYHFLLLFIRQAVLWYATISYSFARQSSDMLLKLFIRQTVLWYVTEVIHSPNSHLICYNSFGHSFTKQSSDMSSKHVGYSLQRKRLSPLILCSWPKCQHVPTRPIGTRFGIEDSYFEPGPYRSRDWTSLGIVKWPTLPFQEKCWCSTRRYYSRNTK